MAPKAIKIVQQVLPWKLEFGDVLGRGRRYVKCLFKEKMLTEYDPIPLTTIADFSWTALDKLGIADIAAVQQLCQYRCPWTDNKFYHFMPWLLLTKDKEQYIQPKTSFAEMAFDVGWTRDMVLPSYFSEIDGTERKVIDKDDITQAMLGHGYTEGTLPCDGHGRNVLACLELSNKDLIAGWLFTWYNK